MWELCVGDHCGSYCSGYSHAGAYGKLSWTGVYRAVHIVHYHHHDAGSPDLREHQDRGFCQNRPVVVRRCYRSLVLDGRGLLFVGLWAYLQRAGNHYRVIAVLRSRVRVPPGPGHGYLYRRARPSGGCRRRDHHARHYHIRGQQRHSSGGQVDQEV